MEQVLDISKQLQQSLALAFGDNLPRRYTVVPHLPSLEFVQTGIRRIKFLRCSTTGLGSQSFD